MPLKAIIGFLDALSWLLHGLGFEKVGNLVKVLWVTECVIRINKNRSEIELNNLWHRTFDSKALKKF